MAGKKSFVFSGETPTPLPADARVANALEHIAYYLDRIDNHLEAVAIQVQAGNSEGARIAEALQGITGLLGRMATKS
jgi:hypothetical protein